MTIWAVLPVKPPEGAKTRLAGALAAPERARLASAMLEHVVTAVRGADRIDRLCLLGPSRLGMPADMPLLRDPGTGLNPALQAALAEIASADATRLIVIHADLPRLTSHDAQLLALAPPGVIAIAPDRHGRGTNALSLPLPEAEGFTFAFGPDSFALHNLEAARLGLEIEEIHSPGLACDIDEPADLPDAAGLMDKAP